MDNLEALRQAAKMFDQAEKISRATSHLPSGYSNSLAILQKYLPPPETRATYSQALAETFQAADLTTLRTAMRYADLLQQGSISEDVAAEQVAATPAISQTLEKYGPQIRAWVIAVLLFIAQFAANQAGSRLLDDSATKEEVQEVIQQAIAEFEREQKAPEGGQPGEPFNERTENPRHGD